jgi:hypothetical protein
MKKKFNQKITLETNGKWSGTKLMVDGKEIYCTSISVTGNQSSDLDFVISLTESKISKEQVKDSCGGHAIGFELPDEEDYDDEDDD